MPTIIDCDCPICTTAREEQMIELGITNTPEADPVYTEIAIPIPTTVHQDVFQSMDLSRELSRSLTREAWLAQLEVFEAACQPVIHTVQVGGYGVRDTDPKLPSGTTITSVPLDTATEYVKVASNDRLILEPTDEGGTFLKLRPATNLENAGWQLYLGTQGSIRTTTDGDDKTVKFREVRETLNLYATFRRRYRRKFIKKALEARHAVTTKVPVEWTIDRAADFTKFLDGVKARLTPEREPFSKIAILPRKTLSSRNWGIEIEAVDIAGVETPRGWELKSDGSLRNLREQSVPSRSKKHADDCIAMQSPFTQSCDCYMSVADYGSSTSTGEWNSPVLRSFHSRGLEHLTNKLEDKNTNRTPGIHVHVEASDLTPTQVTQLAIIYTTLEPLFQMEYERFDRQYCAPVDTAELIKRFNKLREAKAGGKKATEMQFTSRYWTVNAASLSQHGTIEFRAMGARYNYDHLIRWAHFCREMVNIAKADVPQRVWSSVQSFEDLIVLFSKFGKETPTPKWAGDTTVENVIALLGQENRRIQHAEPLNPERGEGGPMRVFDDYTSREQVFEAVRPW